MIIVPFGTFRREFYTEPQTPAQTERFSPATIAAARAKSAKRREYARARNAEKRACTNRQSDDASDDPAHWRSFSVIISPAL